MEPQKHVNTNCIAPKYELSKPCQKEGKSTEMVKKSYKRLSK